MKRAMALCCIPIVAFLCLWLIPAADAGWGAASGPVGSPCPGGVCPSTPQWDTSFKRFAPSPPVAPPSPPIVSQAERDRAAEAHAAAIRAGLLGCLKDAAPACKCSRCKDGCKCAAQDECLLTPAAADWQTHGVAVVPGDSGLKVYGPGGVQAWADDPKMPDYAGMNSLTLVGPKEWRGRIKSLIDGEPDLSPLRGRVREYDSAEARDLRPFKLSEDDEFQAAKQVAIVQGQADATGHAAPHCCYGDVQPEDLARALRDADPNYHPARLKIEPKIQLPAVPVWVWGIVAAVAGLLCLGVPLLLIIVVVVAVLVLRR